MRNYITNYITNKFIIILSAILLLVWSSSVLAASGTTLDFDANDYLSAADNAIFDQADRLSLSVWIEPDDTPTADEYIVYRYNNYYLKMNTSRQIVGAVYGAAWATATSTTVTCDGATWTHLEMTYDKDATGTDELKLYINGNLSAVADYSTAIPASAKKLYIGSGDEAGDNTPEKGFDGQIDDVRLYSYARSTSDVRLDYNQGLAVHLGPTGKTCSEDPAGCMDYGLVGYWSFEEGAGTTAYDASGNGNNGTLTNGPKWTGGAPRHAVASGGGGLQFDGTDDYVLVPEDASLGDDLSQISLEVWIKLNVSKGQRIISADNGANAYSLVFDDGDLVLNINTSNGWQNCTETHNINIGEWAHITGTWNGSNSVLYVNGSQLGSSCPTTGTPSLGGEPVYIGCNSGDSDYFNGTIDDVRIYNRALSAEEIRYHYNRGAPVAHWKFDEGSGDKAYDESPNNNDGLLGGGTADYKPTWVEGKYGSALQFDGTNDYVDCGNSSILAPSKISIESWYYPTSFANWGYLVQRWTTDGQKSYNLFMYNSKIYFTVTYDGGGSYKNIIGNTTLQVNTWYHIVGTYDQENLRLYLNSVEDATPVAWNVPIFAGTDSTTIGHSSYTITGKIDEVRIYNYARTNEQIRMDYQQGVATHLK